MPEVQPKVAPSAPAVAPAKAEAPKKEKAAKKDPTVKRSKFAELYPDDANVDRWPPIPSEVWLARITIAAAFHRTNRLIRFSRYSSPG